MTENYCITHLIQRCPLQAMLKLAQQSLKDPTRPHMYQIRIEPTDDGSKWVFTNGHTLHVWSFIGWIPTTALHVSAEHLKVLIAALKGAKRDIDANIQDDREDGLHKLTINGITVTVRNDAEVKVDRDQFPSWSHIIPVEGGEHSSQPVGFDCRYMLDAMEAARHLPGRPRVKLTTRGERDPMRIDSTGVLLHDIDWCELPWTRVTAITVIMPTQLHM